MHHRAIGLLALCLSPAAQASIVYNNLAPAGPADPGVASNNEFADDLTLDLGGNTTLRSATLRINEADSASGMARIRLNIYTDNAGVPGTLLTTAAVNIRNGGPLHSDELFDFPDVVVTSPHIWAGFIYETLPGVPPFVGIGSLPTVGSTTGRGALRIGPNAWNVQGPSGPSVGPPFFAGDRLQISIDAIPSPAALPALAAMSAVLGLRRRRGARPSPK